MNRRKPLPVDTTNLIYGKVPPKAIELEEGILGTILIHKDTLEEVVHIIKPEAFYSDVHQRIYKAMLALSTQTTPIDLNTVSEQLKKTEELELIGGIHALVELTNKASFGEHILSYARIVHEKYLKREQIRICAEGITQAYEDASDAFESLDVLSGRVADLATSNIGSNGVDMVTAGVRRMRYLAEASQRTTDVLGVPTGYPYMDKITKGWMPTYLILIAARPSVGKTALALNLARNAASNKQKPTPVYLICMEMTEDNLYDRLLSAESGVPYEKITEAKLSDYELQTLYEKGVQPLANYNIKLEYTPSLNILELRAKVRRWLSLVGGDGLVIIDYVQLMTGVRDDLKGQNREQELANISRGLKKLAGECRIPVIALSQMSREVEKRGDKKPQMSDLRESGALEQDADVVAFLQREDYEQADYEVNSDDKDKAWVWFKKNRNGKLEKVPMRTALEVQRWMDQEQYEMYHRNLQGFRPVVSLNMNRNPNLYITPKTGTEDDPF
jgi:replicative DNA helicase